LKIVARRKKRTILELDVTMLLLLAFFRGGGTR